MERDNADETKFQEIVNFNSHAHVERDTAPGYRVQGYANFNSHAHVERDEVYVAYKQPKVISTHTLTWSVTTLQNV